MEELHSNKDDTKITWCCVTMKTIESQQKIINLLCWITGKQKVIDLFSIWFAYKQVNKINVIEKLHPRKKSKKNTTNWVICIQCFWDSYFLAFNWTLAHMTFYRCEMNLKEGCDISWIQKNDSDRDRQGKTYRLLQVPPTATTKKRVCHHRYRLHWNLMNKGHYECGLVI